MRCCPRVVLLDLDGTLIDTMGEYTVEAARIISRLTGASLEEAMRHYRDTMGMPFRRQLELAGVPAGLVEEAARGFEEWKKRLLNRASIPRASVEAVERLRGAGLRVYLSTNNECHVIGALIPQGMFDGVLCNRPGEGLEKGKPHLEAVMRLEGVRPCEVVFIGDSRYDLEVYRGLGVRVYQTRGLWRDHSVVVKILSLEEECQAYQADQGLEG